MDRILVPTSPGELIDKLTILRIKTEEIADPAKLANINSEREALQAEADRHLAPSNELSALWQQLYEINRTLWQVEDDIRACDAAGEFGETFVKLARQVYVTNDRRAEVKKKINLLLGSDLVEEKSYEDYGKDPA